jgi:hypothetical protein
VSLHILISASQRPTDRKEHEENRVEGLDVPEMGMLGDTEVQLDNASETPISR